jgi:hypothetical protein
MFKFIFVLLMTLGQVYASDMQVTDVITLYPGTQTYVYPQQGPTLVTCQNITLPSNTCDQVRKIKFEYGVGAGNAILRIRNFGRCYTIQNGNYFGVMKNGIQITSTRSSLNLLVEDLERVACAGQCE